jgi:hypothetical protein
MAFVIIKSFVEQGAPRLRHGANVGLPGPRSDASRRIVTLHRKARSQIAQRFNAEKKRAQPSELPQALATARLRTLPKAGAVPEDRELSFRELAYSS